MSKLRGHDGAVHDIAADLAILVAHEKGLLRPGTFERMPCLLWTPPATPPKPTFCDVATNLVRAIFGFPPLTPQAR